MNKLPQMSSDVAALNPGLQTSVGKGMTPSKYRNARTEAAGMIFASGHEAMVVSGLIMAEKAKELFALRLQVRFPLAGDTTYVADAVYLDDKLQVHVADAKGFPSKEYKLKKKLFRERYGKDIEEL